MEKQSQKICKVTHRQVIIEISIGHYVPNKIFIKHKF